MSDTFWGLPSAGWGAIYSLATGLYAVLTGSLVAVTFVGMRNQANVSREAAVIQARATSISNNRQQWINSLRDEVTGFLTDMDTRAIMWSGEQNWSNEARQALSASLRRHIYMVNLLINPSEEESTELLRMMTAALRDGLAEPNEIALIQHTQGILKTEWKRVKSGE